MLPISVFFWLHLTCFISHLINSPNLYIADQLCTNMFMN